jgi:hypothetical protein
VFGSLQKREHHMHIYCNDIGGCRRCPHHDTLDRKYGDED